MPVKQLAQFTGNRLKDIFDSRSMDEIVHVLNMLLDLRVIIVDERSNNKNVLLVSDSRIVLPIAIPPSDLVAFSHWKVKEVKGDYLNCLSWNGKKEGKKMTKIAKPMCLRRSRIVETLPDGTSLTYSGWDDAAQSRHADGDDGTSEDQFITPRYLISDFGLLNNQDEFIIAIKLNTFAKDEDGHSVGLVDINNAGRAYAAPQ